MSCPFEDRTVSLAVSDPADPWLAGHVSSCAGCAELIEMTRVMHDLADPGPVPHRLPSAGQVWFKARVAARRAAEEKALRPLRIVESAGLAVALLVAAAGLAGIWRMMPAMMNSVSASAAETAPTLLNGSLAVTIGVSALIVAMAVHRLLARR
ncbi:MAG: hypothetical protein ACREAA_04210 [Candidatus Polarisedimenticolia bacterium]